jgi:hypothetical protein
MYGFATSAWDGVSKVEVGVETYIEAGGNDKFEIQVSGDGGSSWSDSHTVVPTETEQFTWQDVTYLYFVWTPDMFLDANFRVKIIWKSVGGSGSVNIYIDWLPVRVTPLPKTYSPYTDLNSDGIVDSFDLGSVAAEFGQTYL